MGRGAAIKREVVQVLVTLQDLGLPAGPDDRRGDDYRDAAKG